MLGSFGQVRAGRGWTPRSLAPRLWVRADKGITLSGSNVTAWADQSGNGHDLASAGGPPAFSATGWDGAKPGVSFTGSQLLRNLDAGVGDYVNGTNKDFSVFAVVDAPSAAQAAVAEWSDPGISSIVSLWDADSATAPRMELRIPFSAGVATGVSASNGRHVFGWVYSGGTAEGFLDGGSEFSTALGSTEAGVTRFFVGNTWNTAAAGGTFAELAFVPRALSSDDFATFRAYAKALWGGLP